MRPRYNWPLRSRVVALGGRTLIVGVLNVTPDSFSDGGRFFSAEAAVEHGLAMLAEGADMVDVGGESTRPGARAGGGKQPAVSAAEELRRVLPVIERLKRAAPDALISVDTYKAEVARAAVGAGAEIVNDVSALRWDAEMPRTIAGLGCGVVLMHMRGRPEQWRGLPPLGEAVVETVARELAQWATDAQRAGVPRQQIVLDPGFGFGKNFDDNYPLLARFDELHRLGYPLLSGTSRKSFIGRTISRDAAPAPAAERVFGTMATVAVSILKGAHLVRVHDVKAARETAAICDAVLAAAPE